MLKKDLWFKIFVIFYLLILTFPPLNLLLPFGMAMKLAAFLGVTLLLFPSILVQRSFIALLIYALEIFIYYMAGNAFFEKINDVLVPFVSMGAPLALFEYTKKKDLNCSFSKTALMIVCVATIIMIIITIPQLKIDPNLLRYVYSARGEDQEAQALFNWLISWGVVTGLCFIMSPLVFLCKKMYSKNKRFFICCLIVIALFYLMLVVSNITTPLVLGTVSILFSLIFSYEKFTQKNVSKMIFAGIIAFILITPAVLLPVLNFAETAMEHGSSNYKKIEEIKDGLIYGASDSDLDKRNALYDQSWNLFKESPLIGTDKPERISHHSFFIDRLAAHGIFLIIPLIVIFVVHFRDVYKMLTHTRVTYVVAISIFIFLLFYKSDSGEHVWLFGFFILPCLCRYIDKMIDGISYSKKIK